MCVNSVQVVAATSASMKALLQGRAVMLGSRPNCGLAMLHHPAQCAAMQQCLQYLRATISCAQPCSMTHRTTQCKKPTRHVLATQEIESYLGKQASLQQSIHIPEDALLRRLLEKAQEPVRWEAPLADGGRGGSSPTSIHTGEHAA